MTTEQTSGSAAQDTTKTTAQDTSTSTAQEGSPKKREYAQDELDQLFAERATRASQAAIKAVLDKLGVKSEDELPDLKTTIDKAREKELADLTAAERAEKALELEKVRAKTLADQLQAERDARRTDTIKSAVMTKASESKSPTPRLVLLHLQDKHADALKALIGEDGTLDEKKRDALIETAKKEEPHLFAVSGGTPGSPSANGKPVPSDEKAKEQGSRDTRRQLKKGF